MPRSPKVKGQHRVPSPQPSSPITPSRLTALFGILLLAACGAASETTRDGPSEGGDAPQRPIGEPEADPEPAPPHTCAQLRVKTAAALVSHLVALDAACEEATGMYAVWGAGGYPEYEGDVEMCRRHRERVTSTRDAVLDPETLLPLPLETDWAPFETVVTLREAMGALEDTRATCGADRSVPVPPPLPPEPEFQPEMRDID